MLRPTPLMWAEEDITRWLPAPSVPAEMSHVEEHVAEPQTSPTADEKNKPEVKNEETVKKPDPSPDKLSLTVAYTAKQLLQCCKSITHDPLSGWVLDKQTLQSLLIQCPIFVDGFDLQALRIVGDTNLANAILKRLDPDQTVPVTIFDGHAQLIDRLDVLLRSPNSSAGITNELARHTHLLPKKKLRDQDVAEYLGISEAAIRKARNRDRRAR